MTRLITTESCDGSIDNIDDATLTYDNQGLATEIQFKTFTGPEKTLISHDVNTIVRDSQGRVVRNIERDAISDTVLETRNRTYGANGLPTTDTVVFDNQQGSFFISRDTTITYTYEDARCVISYTADPSRMVVLDSILPWSNLANEPALLCGYPVD